MDKKKNFLDWNEEELKTFTLKLVAQGEKWEGKMAVIDSSRLLWSIACYTRAIIMELERLNKKIDKLLKESS